MKGQLLSRLTVLSLEHAVAAPLATRHCADFGATVIKVERPCSGDFARHYDDVVNGLSAHFVWLNRGKQSIALDLKDGEDRRRFFQLLSKSDIFVHNLAPESAERLGLTWPELRGAYPRLIVCEISGYGQGGPYGRRRAYDLLVQSEVGLASVTGSACDPAKVGIPIADIAAGLYAFSGILLAVLDRESSGLGGHVEVSLFDALAELMTFPFYHAMYGAAALPRTGLAHASIAPYGPFPTRDGSIVVAVQNDRQWKGFCCDVLAKPELEQDDRFVTNVLRVANRQELERIICDVLAKHGSDHVESLLDKADVPYGRFRDTCEAASHPQLLARDRWIEVPSPVGRVAALLPPLSLNGQAPAMEGIPDLDEHGDQLRATLDAEYCHVD